MTTPELRNLLADCLILWSVTARIEADPNGITLHAQDGAYHIHPAPEAQRPVRWFYQTPERAAANRVRRHRSSPCCPPCATRSVPRAAAGFG
jgi:hypothetical protein